jgi:hypothetical protein
MSIRPAVLLSRVTRWSIHDDFFIRGNVNFSSYNFPVNSTREAGFFSSVSTRWARGSIQVRCARPFGHVLDPGRPFLSGLDNGNCLLRLLLTWVKIYVFKWLARIILLGCMD